MKKMIENIKLKRLQRTNSLNLKYQALLEERIKQADRIDYLQQKIISLQDQNLKHKQELLDYREKRIRKLRGEK